MYSRLLCRSLLRSTILFELTSVGFQRRPILSLDNIYPSFFRYFSQSLPHIPLPQHCPFPQLLKPHVYSPLESRWCVLDVSHVAGDRRLDKGRLLRIVSWNIDMMSPGRANRALAAMNHLQRLFGEAPPPLVIMVQEVHCESLEAILSHGWTRKYFMSSNIESPQRYFTLMLVSKHVQSENWFRIPFQSNMERCSIC